MSKRPEDYTKAQLIDLVGNLETRLNEVYGVDEVPGADAAALVMELKATIGNMEQTISALRAEQEQRLQTPASDASVETIRNLEAQVAELTAAAGKTDESAATIAGLQATIANQEATIGSQTATIAGLEATVSTLTADRQALQAQLDAKPQAPAPQPGSKPSADLAKAMQASDLDQPIYATLHGTTYDLTEAAGIQACRDAVDHTLGDTGIMLVKLLQHRVAQERFRELSSTLPGGGHNTARMAQLGQAIADASQRLTETHVDGKAVSQLIGRLYQERSLFDQCVLSLQALDMETRRHAKGD
jgi:ABC-type transporter Mla subunit MlaD